MWKIVRVSSPRRTSRGNHAKLALTCRIRISLELWGCKASQFASLGPPPEDVVRPRVAQQVYKRWYQKGVPRMDVDDCWMPKAAIQMLPNKHTEIASLYLLVVQSLGVQSDSFQKSTLR